MLTENHADTALSDETPRAPRPDARLAAYDMFEELHGSTPVERALYEDMLAHLSTPIGVSVLESTPARARAFLKAQPTASVVTWV